MVRLFLLLAGVVWVGGVSQASTLFNAGFESGTLAPWTQGVNGSGFYTGSAWTVSAGAAHSGGFGAVADGNQELLQMFAGIDTTLITEFSFWLRRPNADPITNGNDNVLVTFFYSDSTFSWGIGTITSADWQQFNFTGSITPGKTLVGINTFGYVDGPGSNFITHVDDFVLSSVPEPGSLALLAAGLAGLGLLGRRRQSKRARQ